MELPHRALQQVHALDRQAGHVAATEQLRVTFIEFDVGKLRFLLASRRGEPAVAQVEGGVDGLQRAHAVHIHLGVEHAVGAGRVGEAVFAQTREELVAGERDRHQIAHGRVPAQLAHGVVIVQLAVRGIIADHAGVGGTAILGFRGVSRNRERHLVEVDVLHQVLEPAVDGIAIRVAISRGRSIRAVGGLRRIGGFPGLLRQIGGMRGARLGWVAVEVPVFRIGFGSGGADFARADALERVQRLAHQLADRRILFGHRLFEPDRIDVQRHPADIGVRAEAQRGHHQADAKVVVGAHACAFGSFHLDPGVLGGVVPGRRHHGHAGGGEADGHVAVLEAAPKIHIETVREAQAAQQLRHGSAVHPFRTSIGAVPVAPRRVLRILGDAAACFGGEVQHAVNRLHAFLLVVVENRAELVVRLQRDQRRILQQGAVDLRRLRAGHRVFRGQRADARVAFQPRADRREAVEVPFDVERAQRRRERQRGVPREEIASGIAGRIQAQRLRAVHGLEPLVGVERMRLAHQVGEILLESGDPHVARAGAHGVADGSADRSHGGLAVESAEDVARTEAHKKAVHLRQHVGREEGDGDGVPVFEIVPHGFGQFGARLLQSVAVAHLQP